MQVQTLSLIGALGLGILIGGSNLTQTPAKQDTKRPAVEQNASQGDQAMPPRMAAMMAAMQKAGTPGDHHRKLDTLVGDWKADITMWMDPEFPPMQMEGTAKQEWAFDGHYLQCDFSGDFMGEPFKGLCLMGYDNTAKHYNSLWIDNSSTGMMMSTGKLSEDSKEISMSGESMCPMVGTLCQNEEVLTIEGPDRYTSVMHTTRGGTRYKSMEIVYTRVKTREAKSERDAR